MPTNARKAIWPSWADSNTCAVPWCFQMGAANWWEEGNRTFFCLNGRCWKSKLATLVCGCNTEQLTDSKTQHIQPPVTSCFLETSKIVLIVSTFPCREVSWYWKMTGVRDTKVSYVHKGSKQTFSQPMFQNFFYIVCTRLANNLTCSVQLVLLCT